MLILYYCYALSDYIHRYKQSQYSKNGISQQDLDSIIHFEKWISSIMVLFSLLFLVAVFTLHILFRNNIKVLTQYLLLNVGLFLGIVLLNYVINLFTSIPFNNFMRPGMIIIIVFLFIDVLLLQLKRKELT